MEQFVNFVVEQAFSGWFAQAMRWCACALMEPGYCVLVHARVCSVQPILPHRTCAKVQDETQRRVVHCIGFCSCSAVHCVGGGGEVSGGNIV